MKLGVDSQREGGGKEVSKAVGATQKGPFNKFIGDTAWSRSGPVGGGFKDLPDLIFHHPKEGSFRKRISGVCTSQVADGPISRKEALGKGLGHSLRVCGRGTVDL